MHGADFYFCTEKVNLTWFIGVDSVDPGQTFSLFLFHAVTRRLIGARDAGQPDLIKPTARIGLSRTDTVIG